MTSPCLPTPSLKPKVLPDIPPLPHFTQPTTSIILRRLPNTNPQMISQQLQEHAAILRITPFRITPYPIREDAFVLTLEQRHASILHHTINHAAPQLLQQHSNTTRISPPAPGTSPLPVPPYPPSIDSTTPRTAHNTPAVTVPPSWEPQTASVSFDPIFCLLVGLYLTIFAHWMGYTLLWSSLRSTTSYGLCWHIALLAKAIATAWDLITQTNLLASTLWSGNLSGPHGPFGNNGFNTDKILFKPL
ncbi:expressed unknown protein [Seminavis robusta]|uniref:Uncharacterized protein n=1 Tax=Seminavis robusta TaxID=568900 RepID=A0A9N8HLV1_9STRA|nr:expressed unknown protein [Seminavis robusta]|eukprot:Sro704_g190231.1  (246) ;mRNA; f:14306-15043